MSTKLDEPIVKRVKTDPPFSLRNHFYPPRTSPRSCFSFSLITCDEQFELNPDYVNILPKFIGFEDPYLSIREFEEVCSLIHMPRISNDVVRMKFISFTLEYDGKRWMDRLRVSCIKSYDSFVDIFLKRFFPTSKAIRRRNKIFFFYPTWTWAFLEVYE